MEPERKIEKWLRAYAKKRRGQAGAPDKMHPAMRRLLQGEIARSIPGPDQDNESESVSLWEVVRQQWAFLLSFTICVFLAAVIFFQSTSNIGKRAQNSLAMDSLKQVGQAVQMTAKENNGQLPASLDALTNGYLASRDLSDKLSGKPYVYLGAGKNLDDLPGNTVLAYSPEKKDERAVLFADGRTEMVDRKTFEDITNNPGSVDLAINNSTAPAIAESAQTAIPAESPVPTSVEASPPATQSENAGSVPPTPTAPVALPESAGSLAANGTETIEQPTVVGGSDLENGATFATVAPSKEARLEPARQPNYRLLLLNSFRNGVAPQSLPVLANFQVQQSGNAIRIVDQDGSVYEGSLLVANKSDNGAGDNSKVTKQQLGMMQNALNVTTGIPSPPAGQAQAILNAAQYYFFRVRGTNVTLKQNVVFTGSLMANSAEADSQQTFGTHAGSGGGGGGGGFGGGAFYKNYSQKESSTNEANQILWSNLRIAGTAAVNNTNYIEINAMPVVAAKK